MLDDLIAQFLQDYHEDICCENEYFGKVGDDLVAAIKRACLSQMPAINGIGFVRHGHQRRIPGHVLQEAADALVSRSLEMRELGSFCELLNFIESKIGAIHGIGKLAVYDISERIGLVLDLKPEAVFLHAGTTVGARALGLATNRKYIPLSDFPESLQKLGGARLESFLCIMKNHLHPRVLNT